MKTQSRAVQPMASPSISSVPILPTTMDIHDLSLEQPAVVAYLQAIEPGKQEIALVHGIQVGIAELVARRARARAVLLQGRGRSGKALRPATASSGQARK